MRKSLPYYSFSEYLKERYPFRVCKIPLDAGFTCPNQDGAKAFGGCIYCNNKSFSPNSRGPQLPLREQVARGMEFYRRRFHAEKFIIYFQAFTNTYAPPSVLTSLYDEALDGPDIVGLSIGTRPDCVPDPVLDVVEEYVSEREVWIEYGLESSHDETLSRLNRAHGYAEFVDAMTRTRGRRLKTCVHLIVGLPGETRDMIVETARRVASFQPDGVKIHHLYVAKNTVLEKLYHEGKAPVMTLEEYVPLVADVLEVLPPTTVIQRVLGELHGPYVVAPLWQRSKREVLAAIEAEFRRRGTRQGAKYDTGGMTHGR